MEDFFKLGHVTNIICITCTVDASTTCRYIHQYMSGFSKNNILWKF